MLPKGLAGSFCLCHDGLTEVLDAIREADGLIMTSNAPDEAYMELMRNYQQTLGGFVGPTEIFVSGNTLQLKDYSKLDWEWSMIDPGEKKRRHETVFPQECAKAYDMGSALVKYPATCGVANLMPRCLRRGV